MYWFSYGFSPWLLYGPFSFIITLIEFMLIMVTIVIVGFISKIIHRKFDRENYKSYSPAEIIKSLQNSVVFNIVLDNHKAECSEEK